MEPEGSLQHSQVTATSPYPEPICLFFVVKFAPNYQSRSEVYCMNVSQQDTFLRWGVVGTSPNPQAGGPPLFGCPRPLIQYIRSYPPYWRPFLHPQTEDAPCLGDQDPLMTATLYYSNPKSYIFRLHETSHYQASRFRNRKNNSYSCSLMMAYGNKMLCIEGLSFSFVLY